MDTRTHLSRSSVLNLVALALLAAAMLAANLAPYPAGQEFFEVIRPAEVYSAALANADPALRTVLFFDALFALAYTGAICFAILGFARRNVPVAWFCGLGIVAVMVLDYRENTIMVQSLDIVAAGGELPLARIAAQASVSAIKWQGAAAVLFALSFLLPADTLIEKLLVWGTRLGLALAVPLFVLNAFGLRETGTLFILLSMAGGFVLLAVVTRSRAKRAD